MLQKQYTHFCNTAKIAMKTPYEVPNEAFKGVLRTLSNNCDLGFYENS